MRKWGARVCVVLITLAVLQASAVGVPLYFVHGLIARRPLDDLALDVVTFYEHLIALAIAAWRFDFDDAGDYSGA